MQFVKVHRLGRVLKLLPFMTPADATDPLLKHAPVKKCVFMTRETITQAHPGPFSGALHERVVVETEDSNAGVRPISQPLEKSHMKI
jgi:hypothetical protein